MLHHHGGHFLVFTLNFLAPLVLHYTGLAKLQPCLNPTCPPAPGQLNIAIAKFTAVLIGLAVNL